MGFTITAPDLSMPASLTNIVYFRMPPDSKYNAKAAQFSQDLASRGVLIGGGYGDGSVCRAVCNIDAPKEAVEFALEQVKDLLAA